MTHIALGRILEDCIVCGTNLFEAHRWGMRCVSKTFRFKKGGKKIVDNYGRPTNRCSPCQKAFLIPRLKHHLKNIWWLNNYNYHSECWWCGEIKSWKGEQGAYYEHSFDKMVFPETHKGISASSSSITCCPECWTGGVLVERPVSIYVHGRQSRLDGF